MDEASPLKHIDARKSLKHAEELFSTQMHFAFLTIPNMWKFHSGYLISFSN